MTDELILQFDVIELRLMAGGGGGNTTIEPVEMIWWSIFEEFCGCRFENIVE